MCRAPVPSGSAFCPACGANLRPPVSAPAPGNPAPPPPPAPGAPPVDIRNRVDQDRGTLKRLQLLLPGFRGYREGEDLRAADSLLRLQVADKVGRARGTVENARSTLTQAARFDRLSDLAQVISDLQRLEGEIRHSEQGYTGISPSVRISGTALDRLYEYDYGFVAAADTLGHGLDGLPAAASSGDAAALNSIVQNTRSQVGQLDSAFKARMRAVEGIQV